MEYRRMQQAWTDLTRLFPKPFPKAAYSVIDFGKIESYRDMKKWSYQELGVGEGLDHKKKHKNWSIMVMELFVYYFVVSFPRNMSCQNEMPRWILSYVNYISLNLILENTKHIQFGGK